MDRGGDRQGEAGHLTGRAHRLKSLASLAAIAAATMAVAWVIPWRLVFTDTTATGGDLASHNYAAAMLRDLWTTRHQLTGWVPGNYAGFPLFQMYFPVPFVVSTALSSIAAPNIAFKLTTVLGLVTLPGAVAFLLVRLKTPFPGPAIGASLTLLFLFQTGNSMWGGNIASTLAGEFVYSFSLPIALVYFALFDRALEDSRTAAGCSALIAVLAMTHAYTALWVALATAFALALRPHIVQSALRMTLVFLLGGALCSFWLVPLIAYSPWTTAFKHVWLIRSLDEVLPRPLWLVAALAITATILAARRRGRRFYWRSTGLLYASAAAAALTYAAAPNFGIVDVRFLPFLQLSMVAIAAAGTGHVIHRTRGAAISILIALVGTILLIQPDVPQARQWAVWNYEGFERKPYWPVYRVIADRLRGGLEDPRVVYEHTPENEVFGTIRAFENLPLFSGRSTLEGVNFQASVTSPFIFYIQSEISQVMSCPFAEWGCSRTDLGAGVAHLKMMNVSDFISRSTTIKSAAPDVPDLVHTATVGPYDLYRVRNQAPGYVVPLGEQPYVVATTDWKSAAYRWFKRARQLDPVPVFASSQDVGDGLPFAGVFATLPELPPRVTLTPITGAGVSQTIREQVDRERIIVTGCEPGRPLLVRISYHPRWRSTTGERVWLAGPGFMLVVPNGNRLELEYGPSAVTTVGSVITGAGLLAVMLLALPSVRQRWARPMGRPATRESSKSRRTAASIFISCGVLSALTGIYARQSNADEVYRDGQVLMDGGDLDGARRHFARARQLAPLSNTAIHSLYFDAIVLFRQERWSEAEAAFRRLLDAFPEAHAAPEALYHTGLCAGHAGDYRRGATIMRETMTRYPRSMWAQYAAERLRDWTRP